MQRPIKILKTDVVQRVRYINPRGLTRAQLQELACGGEVVSGRDHDS